MSRNKCGCLLCGTLFTLNVSLFFDCRSLFGLDRTTVFIVGADELNAHSAHMKRIKWANRILNTGTVHVRCMRKSVSFISFFFFSLHQSIPREWKRHWYWFPYHICISKYEHTKKERKKLLNNKIEKKQICL